MNKQKISNLPTDSTRNFKFLQIDLYISYFFITFAARKWIIRKMYYK